MASRSKSEKHKMSTRKPHAQGRMRSPDTGSSRAMPPKRREFRLRPEWHKAVGIASIVAGAALFFVCQLNVLGIHDFGGHIWYLVGFSIAASGAWWLGLFDPPAPKPRRR